MYVAADLYKYSSPNLDSSPDLSPFLLDLDLDLDSDLGRFITKSSFSFHCAHFAVFCLGCMTFCQAVSYTQPKISVTYLIYTAELTRGLACFDSIYCLLGDEFSTEGMEMQISQYRRHSTPVPRIGNVCPALWCRNMDPLDH